MQESLRYPSSGHCNRLKRIIRHLGGKTTPYLLQVAESINLNHDESVAFKGGRHVSRGALLKGALTTLEVLGEAAAPHAVGLPHPVYP
jgi:hypothetical protein